MRQSVVFSLLALISGQASAVGVSKAMMRSEADVAAAAASASASASAAAAPVMPEAEEEGETEQPAAAYSPVTEAEVEKVMSLVDTNQDGTASWPEVLAHAKSERALEVKEAEAKGQSSLVQDLTWDAESETQLKSLFDRADKDQNGVLSLSEISTLAEEEEEESEEPEEHEDEEKGEGEDEAEPAAGGEAETVETNAGDDTQVASLLEQGEGELEADDYDAEAHGDQGEPSAEETAKELHAFIESADTNNDGKLSFDEVKVAFGDENTEAAEQAAIAAEFKAADKNGDGLLDETELDKLRRDAMGIDEHDLHEGH